MRTFLQVSRLTVEPFEEGSFVIAARLDSAPIMDPEGAAHRPISARMSRTVSTKSWEASSRRIRHPGFRSARSRRSNRLAGLFGANRRGLSFTLATSRASVAAGPWSTLSMSTVWLARGRRGSRRAQNWNRWRGRSPRWISGKANCSLAWPEGGGGLPALSRCFICPPLLNASAKPFDSTVMWSGGERRRSPFRCSGRKFRVMDRGDSSLLTSSDKTLA